MAEGKLETIDLLGQSKLAGRWPERENLRLNSGKPKLREIMDDASVANELSKCSAATKTAVAKAVFEN